MDFSSLFTSALDLGWYLKYPLIFLMTPIGGPALILVAGFLLYQGVLEFIPLFIAIALGELTQDTLWYWLGYVHGDGIIRKWGRFLNVSAEFFEKIKSRMIRHDTAVLLGSKMTLGFFTAPIIVLSTAGAARVPFWRYLFLNFLGEILWLTAMLSVGYFFGHLYSQIVEHLKIVFIVGLVILVALALYGFSKYIRKKVMSTNI